MTADDIEELNKKKSPFKKVRETALLTEAERVSKASVKDIARSAHRSIPFLE